MYWRKRFHRHQKSPDLKKKFSPWKGAELGEIPLPRGCFVPNFVEISPVVLERKIDEICQCILSISLLYALRKRRAPSLTWTWISFTEKRFVPSLLDTGAPRSGEGDFVFVKVGKEILLYRCYIPFKKFEKKSPSWNDILYQASWNWTSGFKEEDI